MAPESTAPISAMWGPREYERCADLAGVESVAELSFRFAHGEIDASTYQKLVHDVVKRLVASMETKKKLNNVHKKRLCKAAVMKRHHGKAPLEALVSFESFMLLGEEDTPEAAYRLSLERIFQGINALHQAAGSFIDNSDDLTHKHGPSDFLANIAGRCAFFPINMYTTTKAENGDLSFTPKPRGACGTFVPMSPGSPLVGSVVFDFIKLLFPGMSAVPNVDPSSVESFSDNMQARYGPAGFDALAMLTSFDPSVTENGIIGMQLDNSRLADYLMGAGVDVEDNLQVMGDLRQLNYTLSNKDIWTIAAADAVALPVITKWMTFAARDSVPIHHSAPPTLED